MPLRSCALQTIWTQRNHQVRDSFVHLSTQTSIKLFTYCMGQRALRHFQGCANLLAHAVCIYARCVLTYDACAMMCTYTGRARRIKPKHVPANPISFHHVKDEMFNFIRRYMNVE